MTGTLRWNLKVWMCKVFHGGHEQYAEPWALIGPAKWLYRCRRCGHTFH